MNQPQPRAAALALLLGSTLAVATAADPVDDAPATAAPAELDAPPARPTPGIDPVVAERGRYLVTVIACGDCHTPLKMGEHGPEPDRSRFLAGHPETLVMPPAPAPQGPWLVSGAGTATAWAGPWGTSFTANLTPDDDSGLGLWSYENFRDTLRTGRHLGRGRALLPPMPVPAFRHLSDDDLRAIYSYLRTLPPVSNRVPEPLPPPGPPAGE